MMEHKHLIIKATVNNPPTSPEFIKEWLRSIIEGIGMKLAVGPEANPISYYCDLEGNQGLTGVAILETSHCAIHVWDGESPGVIQFDLYTCSGLDPQQIFDYFVDFDIVTLEWKFLNRETNLIEISNGSK